jgi:hypothetical protein
VLALDVADPTAPGSGAEEAGCEGIQHAAHLHQVSLRFLLQAQLAAAGRDLLLQVGELFLGDAHAIAPDVGNQRRLRHAIEQEAEQQVDQGKAEGNAKWLLDLTGRFAFGKALSLSLGVNNVFDTYPSRSNR